MGCLLVNGIVGVCQYSSSGAERLWISNKSQVTGVTYNVGGEITGITAGSWYEIESALDTITFADDLVVNGARRNFLQTINFALGSIDDVILADLETIGLSNMVAIVKTADGSYRAFGFKGTGLRATVMTSASGTAAGNDANVAVTIAGSSLGKASFLASGVAATLGLV
jgi:hypothetical protein